MENENNLTQIEKTIVDPDESIRIFNLDLEERIIIMWGWLWRSVIVTSIVLLIAGLIGGIAGFIFGVVSVMNEMEVHENEILLQVIGGAIGLVTGFISLAYFIDWITKSRFGKYRFILIKKL